MARISTYIKDVDLDSNDLLIGSEAFSNDTINIPLRALGTFFGRIVTKGGSDNDVLTLLNGNLIPSSITNRFTTLVAGAAEGSGALPDSVYLIDTRTIAVGETYDIFDNALVATGTPVVMTNNVSGEYFYTTVTSVDSDERTLTIPLQEELLSIYGRAGDRSNTITFLGHEGMDVDGTIRFDIEDTGATPITNQLEFRIADFGNRGTQGFLTFVREIE